MSVDAHTHTIGSGQSDEAALRQVEKLLEDNVGSQELFIADKEGALVPLPGELIQLLQQLVRSLARGRPVIVTPLARELTTQQAADILNVSRPFLISQLLETGNIPYVMTGAHRRIAFEDLMAYKRRRDEGRRDALVQLSRMSQELGLE